MADIVPGAVDADGGIDYGSDTCTDSEDGSFRCLSAGELAARGGGFESKKCEARRLRCRQEIFELSERTYTPEEIMEARNSCSADGFILSGGTLTPFDEASDLAKACIWLNILTSDDAWKGELVVKRALPQGPKLMRVHCRPSPKDNSTDILYEQECKCKASFHCQSVSEFMGGLLAYQTTETGKKNEYENHVMDRLEISRYKLSVVGFMIDNIARVDAPGFVRLLRAHIFASEWTLEKVADNMPVCLMDPEHCCVLNALQLSASSNKIPLVVMRTILETGVDVDATTRSGQTPLILAMCGFHTHLALEKVKLLLEYGANIDAYDTEFKNVLHHAAYSGHIEGMKLILDARQKRIEYENGREGRQYRWRQRGNIICTGEGQWPKGGGGIGTRRPLYIDPLHMPDFWNESPLTIAIGIELKPYSRNIKTRNERRKEVVKMLLDAGADADLNLCRPPCAPAWENMEIRLEAVRAERIDQGWRSYELGAPLAGTQPFLCHGIISSQTCRAGATLINITIRKEFYDVNICVSADVVEDFVDLENCDFPDYMDTQIDIAQMFSMCIGARFDFYESKEHVSYESDDEDDSSSEDIPKPDGIPGDMPKLDGADFDICFDLFDDSFIGPLRSKVLLASDVSPRDPNSIIKLAMRFPRGPYPSEFDDAGWNVLRITTTLRDHLTCLQHAAKCPFQYRRKIMIRSAMSICNPLLENSCGKTAVQIMEKTLADATASNIHKHHEVYKLPNHTDRCLLERMRKDHDTMLSYLNLGGSVAVGKKRKTKKTISPFHRIPVDVCRIIHSFVVAH